MEGYSDAVYTVLDEVPDICPPPVDYEPPEEWTDFVNERSILEEEFKVLSTELFEVELDAPAEVDALLDAAAYAALTAG